MRNEHGLHRFAVEPAADGKFYLHFDRAPNKHTDGFDTNRHPEGFDSDEAARQFAREHGSKFTKEGRNAGDDEFAENPGKP